MEGSTSDSPTTILKNKFDVLQTHNQSKKPPVNVSSLMATCPPTIVIVAQVNKNTSKKCQECTLQANQISMTLLLHFDVHGFHSPEKAFSCKELVRSLNLDMLCILEAKIQCDSISNLWFSASHRIFENEDNFQCIKPG
ncbi:hypothetical protein KFK09_019893 [Dendrobium nobile]|uniref:Uncharacterized protein n=1 Tax=Dendrobium nobile TaxID=94219 RepID=A0A8T3ARE9_DENNO|nr:hypothetical protein KFK09_019893 [Dendrobium nobile]